MKKRIIQPRNLPEEPGQIQERILTIESDVPSTALYKVWHIGPGKAKIFIPSTLLQIFWPGGESGRLHTKLVREKKLFSEINAYLTADIDPGLIIVQGKLMKGVDIHKAEESVNEVINGLNGKSEIRDEMEKVKNKFESSTVFSNTSILNKAANLSFFELLGNPGLINDEVESYRKVSYEMVIEAVRRYFVPSNCSTINYLSTRKEK